MGSMMKRNTERGAALVLALLVMLVLSGLGLVAMKASMDSTSLAGMHRMQTQSKSFSDAINQLGVMRSGRQAPALHKELQNRSLENPDPGALRRGGVIIFTSDFEGDAEDGFTLDGDEEVALQAGATGSSFLSGPEFVEAIDEDETTFRYVVRDPIMGPPVPGFGDEFCFLGVTVGSEANIGNVDFDEDISAEARSKRRQALGRNVTQAYIGPIECG